jgi:hypothetical protein
LSVLLARLTNWYLLSSGSSLSCCIIKCCIWVTCITTWGLLERKPAWTTVASDSWEHCYTILISCKAGGNGQAGHLCLWSIGIAWQGWLENGWRIEQDHTWWPPWSLHGPFQVLSTLREVLAETALILWNMEVALYLSMILVWLDVEKFLSGMAYNYSSAPLCFRYTCLVTTSPVNKAMMAAWSVVGLNIACWILLWSQFIDDIPSSISLCLCCKVQDNPLTQYTWDTTLKYSNKAIMMRTLGLSTQDTPIWDMRNGVEVG